MGKLIKINNLDYGEKTCCENRESYKYSIFLDCASRLIRLSALLRDLCFINQERYSSMRFFVHSMFISCFYSVRVSNFFVLGTINIPSGKKYY